MSSKKVVIISGASSGIGLDAAIKFAKHGFVVYAGIRTLSKKADVEKEAAAAGVKVHLLELNVDQDASVEAAVAKVKSAEGRVDVLVNNAGFANLTVFEEISIAEAKATFETNFFGALRLTQAVLPILRAQKSGHIINISSLLGLTAFPTTTVYSASKFALEGWSHGLAQEVKAWNINISVIEPGYTKTPLQAVHGTRTVEGDPYKALKEAMEAAHKGGFEKGDPVGIVGDVILKAATDAAPKFRYPTGAFATFGSQAILKEPTNLQVLG